MAGSTNSNRPEFLFSEAKIEGPISSEEAVRKRDNVKFCKRCGLRTPAAVERSLSSDTVAVLLVYARIVTTPEPNLMDCDNFRKGNRPDRSSTFEDSTRHQSGYTKRRRQGCNARGVSSTKETFKKQGLTKFLLGAERECSFEV